MTRDRAIIIIIFLFILTDKVLFDNSNSYLTNKKIRYSVYMTEPIDDIGEEQPI